MKTRETGTDQLLSTLADGVLTLTLNRPDVRNALSRVMACALADQLAQAEIDSAVKVVVLTGAGNAFCAGGDIKGMIASNTASTRSETIDEAIQAQRLRQRGTAGKLFTMPKPTIAVLPGAAAGAGLSLALACDLRIMARTAVLTTSFARVGLPGDYGGTYFLTRMVGSAKARELYYLSSKVTADEALHLGLTNWIADLAELNSRTQQIAAQLAEGPTIAYRYMKENLNRAMAGGLDDCLDLEATHHVHCCQSTDHKEAAAAFGARREPVFEGR